MEQAIRFFLVETGHHSAGAVFFKPKVHVRPTLRHAAKIMELG